MRRVGWGRVIRWSALIAVPFAIGFVLALLLERDRLPNPLLTGAYRVDLAGLAVRLGALLSLLLLTVLWIRAWSDRRAAWARRQENARQIRARRDFLRRLDHELKNPLTIIHLGLVNLRESPNLTPAQSQSLDRIAQQTGRLQKLVVDLRWLADLVEGRMERAPVDLRDVLEEAIELAQNGAAPRACAIGLRVQETPWPVSPVVGDQRAAGSGLPQPAGQCAQIHRARRSHRSARQRRWPSRPCRSGRYRRRHRRSRAGSDLRESLSQPNGARHSGQRPGAAPGTADHRAARRLCARA